MYSIKDFAWKEYIHVGGISAILSTNYYGPLVISYNEMMKKFKGLLYYTYIRAAPISHFTDTSSTKYCY